MVSLRAAAEAIVAVPVVVASLAVGGESRGAEAHSEGGVDAALRRLLVVRETARPRRREGWW